MTTVAMTLATSTRAGQIKYAASRKVGAQGNSTGASIVSLGDEQAQIVSDERRAKADGYISPYERRRLNRELDEAGRDIYRLKHNDEVARWRRLNHWW